MKLDEQIEWMKRKCGASRDSESLTIINCSILASLKELKAMKESRQSAFREAIDVVTNMAIATLAEDGWHTLDPDKLIEHLEAKAEEV